VTESSPIRWPQTEGVRRVPYRVFTDPAVYEREQERLFGGRSWNYVALDAELPNPGDFKATFIADTPVIVCRNREGELNAMVNRCAHRGALVCREFRGNRPALQCVYHQWTYDLTGNLMGVPFRKGVEGKGGYPPGFKTTEHSLRKLNLTTYRSLVFASFSDEMEPIEEYLGNDIRPWVDRVFNRPVKVLGYARQFIHANWKLYVENVKDPYHASLLHLFHATFNIYRANQGGGCLVDPKGRTSIIRAWRRAEQNDRDVEGMALRTYQKGYQLADPSILESRKEFEVELTNSINHIFPCVVVQQIQNTLATRHILPKGPDSFELLFTFFGYQDDDAQMDRLRLKHANLVGPAGYISMEDGYATELVQQAILRGGGDSSYIELGGDGDVEERDENLNTEAALRSFWRYYRSVMEI
jgi:anthranilate 1,2-dioxygenase large subunit